MSNLPTELLKDGKPKLLSLKLTERKLEACKVYDIGTPSKKKVEHKKVLVLGETGAGKTSFLNSLTNYIMGVDFKDDKRYMLIHENTGRNQSESQTSELTAYTIHHQPGFRVEFTLTIVDTPGFADTRGIEHDKRTCEQIHKFFLAKDGFDDITAIIFVFKPNCRLTQEQKYIINSVLSFFGKNLKENVIIIVTNGSSMKPGCLDTLKNAKIHYNTYFQVENKVVLQQETNFHEENDEGAVFEDLQVQWNLTWRNLNKFVEWLDAQPSKSIRETQYLLNSKMMYQDILVDFKVTKASLERQIQEIEEQKKLIKENESNSLTDQDFEYDETETTYLLVQNPQGIFSTICQKCEKNCHHPCDERVFQCQVFNSGLLFFFRPKCLKCSCKKSDHDIEHDKHYELVESKVKRTFTKLMEIYKEKHKTAEASLKDILKFKEQEKEELTKKINALEKRKKKVLKIIQESALSPDAIKEITTEK